VQDAVDRFGVGFALAPATVRHWDRLGRVLLKEEIPSLTQLQYIVLRHSNNLHKIRQLFRFIFSRENRLASIQFSHDTAKRPHIDSRRIGNPEDYFGRPVEPRLDIGVDALVLEAATPIVDQLYAGFVMVF